MLFHMNTEVFAYNSIKNRHEILTKSLYSYRLHVCSKCPPSASTQLTDDVAIDHGVIHNALFQFTPNGDKTLSQLVNVVFMTSLLTRCLKNKYVNDSTLLKI